MRKRPVPGLSPTPADRGAIANRIRSYLPLEEPPEETDPAGNRVIYPSVAAVDDAVRFVNLLPPRIPLPKVGRADDGEIVYFARAERSLIDCDGTALITGSSLPRDLTAAIAAIAAIGSGNSESSGAAHATQCPEETEARSGAECRPVRETAR